MKLHDLASRAFVLLRADATVEAARAAVPDGQASHVIVDGGLSGNSFLIPLGEAFLLLASAPPDALVSAALGLDHRAATLVLNGQVSVDAPPSRLIVKEEGQIVGFIDDADGGAAPTAPPEPEPVPVLMPEPVAPPSVGAAPPPAAARRTTRSLEPSTRRAPDGGATASGDSRSLEAEFPERVQLGSVATLSVFIASEAPTEHGLALDVRADDRIDIVVQPRSGFVLDESDDRARITVPESGESKYVQFKLKAVEVGPASVRVRAFRAGEPLGLISLESVVVPEAGRAVPDPRPKRAGSRRLATPSPQLPDLTLFVEEWQAGDDTQYRILLTANDPALELNLHTYGPFTLELDPAKFFDEFFTEIEQLPLGTKAERDLADRRLAAKGAYLSQTLLPEDLREKL